MKWRTIVTMAGLVFHRNVENVGEQKVASTGVRARTEAGDGE